MNHHEFLNCIKDCCEFNKFYKSLKTRDQKSILEKVKIQELKYGEKINTRNNITILLIGKIASYNYGKLVENHFYDSVFGIEEIFNCNSFDSINMSVEKSIILTISRSKVEYLGRSEECFLNLFQFCVNQYLSFVDKEVNKITLCRNNPSNIKPENVLESKVEEKNPVNELKTKDLNFVQRKLKSQLQREKENKKKSTRGNLSKTKKSQTNSEILVDLNPVYAPEQEIEELIKLNEKYRNQIVALQNQLNDLSVNSTQKLEMTKSNLEQSKNANILFNSTGFQTVL